MVEVRRLKINSSTTRQDAIAPVLVKFRSKETARKVFKLKSKLVRTGIFLTENLTKQRRDIMNLAREKYGNKQVWYDQGPFIYALRVMLSPVAYGRCKMSLSLLVYLFFIFSFFMYYYFYLFFLLLLCFFPKGISTVYINLIS